MKQGDIIFYKFIDDTTLEGELLDIYGFPNINWVKIRAGNEVISINLEHVLYYSVIEVINV